MRIDGMIYLPVINAWNTLYEELCEISNSARRTLRSRVVCKHRIFCRFLADQILVSRILRSIFIIRVTSTWLSIKNRNLKLRLNIRHKVHQTLTREFVVIIQSAASCEECKINKDEHKWKNRSKLKEFYFALIMLVLKYCYFLSSSLNSNYINSAACVLHPAINYVHIHCVHVDIIHPTLGHQRSYV